MARHIAKNRRLDVYNAYVRSLAGALAVVLIAAAVLSAAPAAAQQQQQEQQQPRLSRAVKWRGGAAPKGSDGEDVSTPLVVGGVAAASGRFPYQVGINVYKKVGVNPPTFFGFCGGSLIRDDVVLTAAHCLDTANLYSAKIYPGTLSSAFLNASLTPNYEALASDLAPNPQYNATSFDSDVALIYLNQCIANGGSIAPVQLASRAELQRASRSPSWVWLVSGWGRTSNGSTPAQSGTNGNFAAALQVGAVNFVRSSTCQGLMNAVITDGQIYPDMICAGGRPAAEGNQPYPPLQSACIGDSGGPLTFNVGKAKAARSNPNGAGSPADDRQVGIVSWVVGCGLDKIPAVYTNIPYWHRWIKWQLQARLQACQPAGTTTAEPICRRSATNRNWYGVANATVKVDKKNAYQMCCDECLARGDACKAFSVNTWQSRRRRALAQEADGARLPDVGGSGSGSGSGGGGGGVSIDGASAPLPGTAAAGASGHEDLADLQRAQTAAPLSAPRAAACTTCDADCDIFVKTVPARLCERGETAPVQSRIYCSDVRSLGSGRIKFIYK